MRRQRRVSTAFPQVGALSAAEVFPVHLGSAATLGLLLLIRKGALPGRVRRWQERENHVPSSLGQQNQVAKEPSKAFNFGHRIDLRMGNGSQDW